MGKSVDFLKRHTLVASLLLLVVVIIIGHGLWLLGIIPDNHNGGKILYGLLPFLWFLASIVLILRRFR